MRARACGHEINGSPVTVEHRLGTCPLCTSIQEVKRLQGIIRGLKAPVLPLDLGTNAHSDGPVTAHLAAEASESHRARDCLRLFNFISLNPGRPVHWLSRKIHPPMGDHSMNGSSVGKRVSDLVKAGLVVYWGRVINRDSGQPCGLAWVAGTQPKMRMKRHG